MPDNSTILIFLIINLVLLVVVLIFLFISKNNNKSDEVKSSIAKDFIGFSKNINDNMNTLQNNISNRLIETYKLTNQSYNQINEKIVKIDEAQNNLNNLSKEIVSLQNILQDKKNRGTFGETELYSILESVFGTNESFWKKQYKFSNDSKVDAVVFMANSDIVIPVDSKFPLENYRRIYDIELDENNRNIARKGFKSDVIKHIDDIANKYLIEGETIDLAYMFVPSEAIYSEIYSNYPDVIDYSYKKKVFIVSPTTLLAYLTAIRSIYLGQKKNEKAKEIEKLLNELAIEFNRFKLRNEDVFKDFQKISKDYDQLNITTDKLIKKFAKINNGELNEDNDESD